MEKSAAAFRTIGEVAEWLGEETHVLRFWESKFSQIKPVKRAGGRRYYRPSDMLFLGGLKKLLHEDGMTIKGVQKVLRSKGVDYVASLSRPLNDAPTNDVPASDASMENRTEAQRERQAVSDATSGDTLDGKAKAEMDMNDVLELKPNDTPVGSRSGSSDRAVTSGADWPLAPLQLDISQVVFGDSDSAQNNDVAQDTQNATSKTAATGTHDTGAHDTVSEENRAVILNPEPPKIALSTSENMDDDGPLPLSVAEPPARSERVENKIPQVRVPKDPLYREVIGPTGVLTRIAKISALPAGMDTEIISNMILELEKATAQKPI